MSELSIKVTLATRVYPLTIARGEEEYIRKAAKLVNENIKELELNYAVRDRQDLLAMTALFYATKDVEKSATPNQPDSHSTSDELKSVVEMLEAYIKQD